MVVFEKMKRMITEMSLTILKVLDINSTNGLKSTQQQDHDLFILRGL